MKSLVPLYSWLPTNFESSVFNDQFQTELCLCIYLIAHEQLEWDLPHMTSGVWGHQGIFLELMEKSSTSAVLWFILSCLEFPFLAFNMFCSLNYRYKTQQGRCCMYLPSNAEEMNSMAPATEPWLLPETVLFFLRGCLIPSLIAGKEPVSALDPICCWMVSYQGFSEARSKMAP